MTSKNIHVISTLLPSHSELQPILGRMREKYDLPEGGIIDSDYAEQILERDNLPWETIREEIKTEIENIPDLWPPGVHNLFVSFRKFPEARENPDAFVESLELEQGEVSDFVKGMYGQFFLPLWGKIEEFVTTTTDLLLVFLATGETGDIPFDWTGSVQTMSSFGEPAVFAMAGQLSDPKEIMQQFMTEYNRVFGKDRPRISQEFINSIDLLRMKFDHVPLKDIADVYIQRNRSQFSKDGHSAKYRAQKRRLEERLKKRFQRHEEILRKIVGDTSKD